MTTQATATYGLNRSPTLAAFQNGDTKYLSLLRSMMPGKVECAYVDVQIVSRITKRREVKLKRAV
jgi:hypothetical protein